MKTTDTYTDAYALFNAMNNGDDIAEKLYNFYWYTRAAGISEYVTDIELIHDGVQEWIRYMCEGDQYEVLLSVVDENTEDPRRVLDHVLIVY